MNAREALHEPLDARANRRLKQMQRNSGDAMARAKARQQGSACQDDRIRRYALYAETFAHPLRVRP